jgi:TolB-like protein/chromate transport protein ChrA/Tfp pilus assembly protein PilF
LLTLAQSGSGQKAGETMGSSGKGTAPSGDKNRASLTGFLQRLRKRRIIETLAAFIGGGWLLVEVVERLLVSHYGLPGELIDLTVVSVIGGLLATLAWRWFRSADKRPGNVKIEVLFVPLILLLTLAIDLAILLKVFGIPGKVLLVAAAAACLGIVWVILKLSQWASAPSSSSVERVQAPAQSPAPTLAVPEKSIAVLPFTDLSQQKDQEYFCDGMSEEIITDLSHVHDLLVISRSSAMTFKGTQKRVREIAQELNVHYVLEGSLRKAGNDLRITAQLIDAKNDAHLWAEKYSGTLDDVFDMQEKISRSIVDALKLKLSPEEKRRIAEKPISDLTAYECYLRANAETIKCTGDAIHRAVRYLQDALTIIGENAFLYTGIAFAYLQLVNVGAEHEECLAQAEEYAKKALAMNPEFGKAHAMLGWIAMWSDPRTANEHLKRASSISPDDTLVLQGSAMYYVMEVGKIAAAARLLERLVQVDPLDFTTKWLQGGIHFYNGEYDLALSRWQKLYDIYPEIPIVQFYLAATMVYLGQVHSAFSLIDQSASATPNNAFTKLGLMLKYATMEDKDKAFLEMTPDFQKTCQRDITFSHHLAGIFSLLGSKKDALDWLQSAIERGFINYPLLAEKDTWLANIRGEERFKKLMERVKYEWEHFEV